MAVDIKLCITKQVDGYPDPIYRRDSFGHTGTEYTYSRNECNNYKHVHYHEEKYLAISDYGVDHCSPLTFKSVLIFCHSTSLYLPSLWIV